MLVRLWWKQHTKIREAHKDCLGKEYYYIAIISYKHKISLTFNSIIPLILRKLPKRLSYINEYTHFRSIYNDFCLNGGYLAMAR